LTGCFGTCPAPVVIVPNPELVYPKFDTKKELKISGRKENGNIVLTPKVFKAMTSELVERKYQVRTLSSIMDTYNKWDPTAVKTPVKTEHKKKWYEF
jgi:hypothetical protein